jgi:heme/copper-type cytochrome/quinol oxidase subunit 3
VGAVALLLMGMGAAFWFNGYGLGGISVALGFATLVFMLFGWFGKVISESEAHIFSKRVDISFRWAMSWFIFSEVMFFAAFFGALFYVRNLSVPDLGAGTITGSTLWPNYSSQWPTEGPYFTQRFTPMGAMGIPLLNTIILLTSGVTLTIAHHALKAGHRGALAFWLFATIALGFTFLGFQAYEYTHAYSELNLKLSSGRLRLDVLHADRVPRHARDGRRDHADRDARPRAARPLRRAAPLRVRGRGVVLALRRRGVAAAVRARVLALTRARRFPPRGPRTRPSSLPAPR